MCKPDLDRRRIPPNLQYAARLSLSRRLPSSASNESVAAVSFVYLADSIRVHFLKLKRRSERQEHGAPTEALTESSCMCSASARGLKRHARVARAAEAGLRGLKVTPKRQRKNCWKNH